MSKTSLDFKIKLVEIPQLYCYRCEKPFFPQTDDKGNWRVPERCPKQYCRTTTWNVPNSELQILHQERLEKIVKNLEYGPGALRRNSIKVKKIDMSKKEKLREQKTNKEEIQKIVEKKIDKKIVCKICELFFHDDIGKKRHDARVHSGLCRKCNTSNTIGSLHKGEFWCDSCQMKLKEKSDQEKRICEN